ncbi:hypothetical protein D9615_005447 [Tricholomella constricta]|uniref:Uncharacterized protein n=1 Tax=Tricholomella constricta TaxID=117010 RepID=A0A8H5M5A5_9AGAR|nr:hypothetical protein D9615_005447 [Tricholomella constricta]
MSTKSRIPQPKPSAHETSAPDVVQVHSALLALGAPPIALEDFTRLYHGPFADVLAFLSVHIKGRKRAAGDRWKIERIRSARTATHIPRPTGNENEDPTRSPTDRALVVLGSARRTANAHRAQLGERQAAHMQSRTTRALGTAFVLGGETPDRATTAYFGDEGAPEGGQVEGGSEDAAKTEIGLAFRNQAMKDVCRSSTLSSNNVYLAPHAPPPPGPPIRTLTHETLTNLHSYHLRLTRLVETQAAHEPSTLLMARLRQRLAKIRGPKADAEELLERCCSVARARAGRALRYKPAQELRPEKVTREELEGKAEKNRAKREELQQLSDHAVALGFLCEHLIASISVFVERTAPVLRASVEEEARLAKGYVDVLRLRICAGDTEGRGHERDGSFVEDVQRACGIRVPNDPKEVIHGVERLLQRSGQQSSLITSITSLRAPAQTSEEEALIAAYHAGLESVEDRARRLLTRKADKAALGETLVRDIERLKGDLRTIVG